MHNFVTDDTAFVKHSIAYLHNVNTCTKTFGKSSTGFQQFLKSIHYVLTPWPYLKLPYRYFRFLRFLLSLQFFLAIYSSFQSNKKKKKRESQKGDDGNKDDAKLNEKRKN